ncbi:interleukin-like EMT inducer domain-containing protein [Acinetobacter baumannii]|uniref:interleukin-like EMT inducer domain-containing protein n=1 Tax=Acinetobacter baumannii TaxID=470 RepID=UPI000A271D42|nr:interleukin-like EMT inducer domain-containing protein [Acinetobacter baumannii]
MNGLKRAKILSYNAKGRTAQVHIHGLTDGASEGITATFAYPVGDSDLDTEIQIVDGEDVYVFFENGNEERPVIHSYVSHGDGAIVGVRRIRQDNIEFISKENLKVDSGTTVSIKTPLMNVQANTQQTGNSTLTGNSTVVGNTSVAGNSAVAGSMAVGTTLTVAGVPIDPKAIEGAFKDALNKLESLKEELKEQGEKIDETKDQVSQEIDEKIKEVEELIENIKDSDAFKLLEEGMKHFDEEVQKIHEQVKEVNQIAQNKVDEVRAYIDQEINNTKLIVDQHNNEANLRLDEANQRIDQSIQANEALVADAQQRAIRAEKELDDKIGFIKSETDSIIADVRSDSNEIRLVAENAKKIADQEVLDRKKQAADTLNVIDQTKAALKQDIDQNLVKAGQMIDDAKLALGEETNTLINQKIEPVVTQTEAAVKKVDQIAAQYIDLDKKVDSGFLAEAEARANDKEALTQSFELKFAEMQNEFGKSNALISEDIKTLAAQDKAFTEQISTAQSQIGDNKTAINKVERTVSDLNQSIAEKTSQIESTLKNSQEQIEGNAANIEKVESSVKLVDEKVVSEAKKLEDLKTDFNSNKTKTESDIATITQSVSDGDKALSLRIDQTKAALEEADRKSNANILEVTESLTELEQSTASKFSELDTSISKENLKVQGQITDVQKSVSTLESNTNTSINGLSSSLKTTDDLAKLAFDNAAEAQQTGTTAVKTTEAPSQNLLSLKSQTQVTSGVRAVVTTKGIDDWTRWRTTAEAKVIQDSDALGGYILELGNNADNDETWVHWNEFVKINPDTLYRVRARFRRVAGESGTIYLGVACKNADQSKYVTTTNSLAGDMGSSNYLLSAVKPNLGEWQEVVLYMKGKSTGAATGLGTIDNPRTFPAQAEYYAPMFTANYNFQTGICQLNYIIVEDNNSLASANDATATANDLFKTATNRTEAEAERTSKLESRMQNAETGIQSNAQALLKTATKSDLDSAMGRVATDITAAVNNIKIGGVNAVANSEAPRTSTAATSREYLMYERSKELKAFYDENLDKPVTISFEVSVPVAGSVQVYSSNGSAHFFATSVTVTKANEFQKFAVTVFPKLNTGSSTESTIEFYGTYGTGRIPTIQKLQIEAGNKATAWSPSPRDTQSSLNANAEAIKVTQAEVKKHGDTLSSQSLDISKLRNDLTITNTEVSKKASTEALQTTNSQVSEQAGLIKAVTEQANTLSANLKKSAPAGTNLLINSNVVGNYDGISYPHLRYKLGEDWEVGAKYTLLWCAEHTRGAGDTNSNLAVYAGGGSQFLQQVINTSGKVISKITFTKTSAGTAKEVNFYMLSRPTADKQSVGTVYWAVLVKGEFITTDNWIASPYDFNAAFDQVSANLNEFKQTYVTESTALAKKTQNLESTINDPVNGLAAQAKQISDRMTKSDVDSAISTTTEALKTSIGGKAFDNIVVGGNVEKSKTGGYVQISYPLAKSLNAPGITVTVRAKVTFDNGGNNAANLRIYIGGANVFNADAPIFSASKDIFEFTLTTIARTDSTVVNFACFPNSSANANATTTVHWVEVFEGNNKALNDKVSTSTLIKDYSSKADTAQAITSATETLEAKFRQKFGDLWTNSSATLDSTRYTKTETNQAIAEESKIIKAAISTSGGDNIIKNGDFSSPLGTLNWRQNSAVAGNLLEVYKDSKGATWGHFKSTDTTTYFKGFIETLTLADGLEMNQKYTLSFKAMSLTAAQTQILLIIHRRDSSGSNNQIGTTWNNISTDKETLCTYTFDTNIINLQHINLILYSQVGFAPDFLIREVQLEKGELATGFRKNPRELIKDLEANASAIEGTKADVQKNGEKITSLAENYATLKSTVDNNKTAVDGKFQEINSTISDNQQNTTQSINNLESSYKQLNQDLGQVFNYRVYSCGWNGFFTGIKNLKGEIKSVASARGFSVHVLAADGSIASSTRYDTYAAVANATAMSNAIAAIPNDTFVIVTNYDSIGVNLAPVKNALISLGANPFTLDQITGRDAYILVGQKGIGSGRGIELHATPDTGPNGAKQIMLAVQVVSGIPIGLANNSGNLQKVLENHAQILQEKITRSDAKEVFAEEIKVFKAQLDTLRYSEENWILLGDDTKNLSISTGTNRTVAVWELQYKHKEIPIDKGDPIVARIKYTATAGLVGATCLIQFHGATYGVGLPAFTVAASGEIELTGIFPSDLKASAYEAIPLGLRFDNAPSGGTITITNMFISRGNSAPNFKGGFRSSLKQNAQFVEDTFIKADVNKGVITQQIQQYDATVPGGLSSVVKTTKATADQTSKDLATLRNTEISQLQTSTNNLGSALENTTMLAMMITNGKLLQGDVNFKKGNNGVSVYNNAGNGNVTVTRVAKSSDNPTTSTHEIEIKTTGAANPTWGGFFQLVYGRANAVFVIKYLIKLPVGYKLVNAGNAMGTGAIDRFIGNTEGTGKFETYIRMIKCGAVGTFSNAGHVYVAGGPAPTPESPLIWTLAQIECYDVTDYASADPNLQDFVSTANESLGTLTNFKETWASKLTEMSSKLDRTNSAYILNSDLTNTNIERAIAASSNQLKSEYIDPLQKNTESLKENILTNVDLSGLNPDIYYPVIFQLATGKQKYDFKVFCTLGGQNNSNVPWATHGTRSFGLNCEWSVTANGWGTQAENRIIDKFSFSWTAQSPLINIKQMPNSSIETVFLRGGARYDISHYKTITPLIKTESFTALGQSIEPIQYNSSLVPVPIFAEIVKAQDTAAAASRTVADIQRDYVTSSKLNEAVASSNERLSALYSANSQTIMASALQTFEKDWIIRTPSGSRIGMRLIEDQTCRGGYALRMGDNSGNDEIWLNWFSTLPIDDNKMYRIKYRYRRVSGAGVVYVGATCFNAAKSAFITDANYINGDIGSSHYVVGGAAPALGSWVTGVAYFKGRSAGASSGAGTLTNPKTFANKAAFFTPVFIGNYAAQAGEVDLDYIDIEDADNIAEFESFKTTYTTDVGAYAGSLQTLTSVYGPNAINLKSQVDLINGMKGKYVMGMDNNGVFSGLSMVSEQNNGTVQTSIGFQADRIFFTTGSSSTKYMPFIVQDNQVIMNSDVFIKNLTAANFKAKSLTAEVLNVDSLSSITGNFGTFISVAPDGSKQIISGGSTQIFYPNGNLAMRIGIK